MSRSIVALMVRTGIPFTTWLDQPDGVIETAIRIFNEQDRDQDSETQGGGPHDDPDAGLTGNSTSGWSG